MRRKLAPIIATFFALTLLATTASAFSVTFSSVNLPFNGWVGASSTFSANIRYDSRVQGIPLPADGHFHVEIPRLYRLPTITSGSWPTWDFTARTGSMTGAVAWEGRRSFFVFGEITREATFTAIAEARGTSQSYIGTGPNVLIGANFFRTVTVH